MKFSVIALCALAFAAVLVPATSQAALTAYSQDFEGLNQADGAALGNDGWLVYGNVFAPDHTYLYGYGPFPAPNTGGAFCQIVLGEGGAAQGAQQLVVISDYNNADHGNGNLVESNVYHEQTIDAVDAGHTWVFDFQAKLGNIAGATTAAAFIKTLDPNNGYAMTNYITVDMTSIPATWGDYQANLTIDASLVGQIFQFGFTNTATNYDGSGIFYDNINFHQDDSVSIEPTSWSSVKALFE